MGGGGAFGIAYHLGVTRALIDAGVRVDQGPMFGVSAGAYAAAALVTDTHLDTIMGAWDDYGRSRRRGRARTWDITGKLFGHRRDSRVNGVCTTATWPMPVVLNGAEHGLGHIVAAAASPIGAARGHEIAGRRLFDAGMYWNTAAHRAPSAELLVVIAPLCGDSSNVLGRMWDQQLRYELHPRYTAKHKRVVLIRPDADVIAASNCNRLSNLLSTAHAPATYRAAYQQGARLAEGVIALRDQAASRPVWRLHKIA